MPPVVDRLALVPAAVERRLPRGARARSARTSQRCRRGSRASGWCRPSGRRAAGSVASAARTSTSTRRTSRRCASRRGTSRSWSSRGVMGIAVIVGLGGVLVDNPVVTVGTVLAFVLYLNNLFEPIQQLSQLYNTVQSAGAALHKLFFLLDTDASVHEKPGAVDLPAVGALVGGRRRVRATAVARPTPTGVVHPLGTGGAARRDDLGRAGRAARARRTDRRGQVDARQAHGAVLRPTRRHRRGSATWTCARPRSRACAAHDRRGAPGGLPLRGHDPRQRPRRAGGATDAEVDDAVAAPRA